MHDTTCSRIGSSAKPRSRHSRLSRPSYCVFGKTNSSVSTWFSCFRASWYTKTTNKMQMYRIIYYSLAALHVSSDIFAYHQEHLKCITASAISHVCRCRLVSWECWNSTPAPDGHKHRVIIPEVVLLQLSSWGWAQSYSKHVEDSNKHFIEETVRQVGNLPELYENAR
jgi:hypothetical protein